MTDPLVSIEPERVSVEPGGQARVVVTVTNPGTIVEGYDVDVVGESPIPWAQVEPPTVSVYPQQQASVVVVFSPPGGPGAASGAVTFGVRARSQVDPSASAVTEGQIEIGGVFGLQAKLTPVTSTGRWSGKHTIRIDNWGNAHARLRLMPSDPDQALGFLVRPDVVDVPLGGSATAKLKVRTRHPQLRGTPLRLPFQVVCEPDPPSAPTGPTQQFSDPRRPVLDGAMTQKPIVSRLVVVVASVAAVLLVAGAAFALTRPNDNETFEDKGPPSPPTALAAAPVEGSTAIRLTWGGVPEIEKYTVLTFDPESGKTSGSDDVSADLEQYDVPDLEPVTEYCFAVIAVRGDLKSVEQNPPVCQTTGKAPAESGGESSAGESSGGESSSPPESTAPGQPPIEPGQWVALVEALPDNNPGAQATAQARRDALIAQGIASLALHSIDFEPPLTVNPSWVVVTGPSATEAEALAECTKAKAVVALAPCNPLQPTAAE